MILPAGVCESVISTTLENDANVVPCDAVDNAPSETAEEIPFAIVDISTFASQPYYSYDSPCSSRNSRNIGVCGDNAVADPTFPQAWPFSIIDYWSYCNSQVPNSDEQNSCSACSWRACTSSLCFCSVCFLTYTSHTIDVEANAETT